MTDLQAANEALIAIGVDPIGSLSDQSKAARAMNLLIPSTKNAVLGEFPWSFAARMEPLSSVSITPPPGYSHMFAYPASAVNVFRVYDKYSDSIFFTVAEIGGANYIAANVAAASVEYTVNITNLNLWRSDVEACFIALLAHKAGYHLTSNQNLILGLFEKYMMLVQAAKGNSVVEEKRPHDEALDYVLAR